MTEAETKARILAAALPWIRAHQDARVVVKIGGEALEDAALARTVVADLALLSLVGMRLVVVHGGGPQVSRAMQRAGLEASFVGGLRVTDDAAFTVVRQVLVGEINQDLVSMLNAAGARAVGISGADGGLLRAKPQPGPNSEDLGRVGAIDEVDPSVVDVLFDAGYTPVVAPVAPDADGRPLNVNADTAAGAIAAALGAAKLVYLTNVDGLYRDFGDTDSLVSELKADELSALVPTLSDGMRPKAESAVAALDAGVGKVHILDGRVPHALLLEVFTDEGVGTQIQ
ncbi:MAG TPA: acetylglutamate kinase [Actinomycetota bacterium]|nr:acetylglutamate kinase [Actinomycetota bacterium]